MKILVVNGGSSSHKLSLFDIQNGEPVAPLWQGNIEWGRKDQPASISVKTFNGAKFEKILESNEIGEGFQILLNSLWEDETRVIMSLAEIERIGHRVVHGGSYFEQPTIIDSFFKEKMQSLISLAPLHNRNNLEGIEWMEKLFPDLMQIAVFDTSYHFSMPDMIKTYPIPWEWKEKGIQRYGFHGISHQYCAERAAKILNEDQNKFKMINCHLGNGCSLCAIKDGKSYETSMGFTPLEGLMMGTRCGSIDPGILLYLLRQKYLSVEELDHTLNYFSGLLGIGGASDMRDLLARQNEELACLAVKMFVHRLKTSIGAMAVSLEGFHVLSFTGGIGENSPAIREETCKGLKCLGVDIDLDKNRSCQPDMNIATASSINVLVIHTQEEWMIARTCYYYM